MSDARMIHAPLSFNEWRGLVRNLIDQHASPTAVVWSDRSEQECFPGWDQEGDAHMETSASTRVSPNSSFWRIARQVYCHRDPVKWSLLYRVLWRLTSENLNLMSILSDADVHQLQGLERDVRRDTYRMTQFVRFKPSGEHGDRMIAWHKPDHDVLELAVPFFVKRFASFTWSIVTPMKSAHWDGATVHLAEGLPRAADVPIDNIESLWRVYYASVYDPARLNIKAMRAQMPVRHWNTLPESSMILPLIQASSERVTNMIDNIAGVPGAAAYLPASQTLPSLRTAAASCRGCALHCSATQTVFGTGPVDATIMLIGEQPGDEEDLSGLPFVGPAGRLLNQALMDAGLDRNQLYLTNAVKHFKFVPAGKVRKHQKPSYADMVACRPWLEAEFAALRPSVVVCLGGSAGKALFGSGFRPSDARGKWHTAYGIDRILTTYHPAAVLRAQPEARDALYSLLVEDLRRVTSVYSVG
jgi:probable DNA metabolism protein